MAESRSLRLRLGLFVAAALGVLAALVVLFGGAPGAFSGKPKYVVLFPEAPNIAPGTPVRKSGVRIGEVTDVGLDEENNQVRVGIQVDPKYLPRTGEDPVISRGLLSGDTTLDFVPKTNSDGTPLPRGDQYPPGSEIQGVAPVNTRVLLNQASGAIPTAQESLVQLTQTAQRFEKATPKVEKAADEVAGLARSGREFVPELRQTNTQVQALLGADDPKPDPLKPDEERPTTVREALREIILLLQAIRPVADDVRALLKENGPQLNSTLKSVETASNRVSDTLNPENQKQVAAILKNLNAASDDLTRTIRLVAILADSADKTLKELNARLAQSEKAIGNIEKATRPFAESSDELSKNVNETARNLAVASGSLNQTLTDVQGALKLVTKSEGTVGKALADPSLYNNLNDATVNLARVLARAEQIAKDLQVFADKVARKPETIGLGGVVSPSTGLKEYPTAPLPQTPPLPVPPAGPLPQGSPPAVAPIAPVPLGPGPAYKPPAPDLPPLPPTPSDPKR